MALFQINTKEDFNIFSKEFWIKIMIMTIAIWVVCLTSLASVDGALWAVCAALVISLLNAFIRPLLHFISLPLIVATFGLFLLIINTIIVLLTSAILGDHFTVSGFWNAFFFSIIVTVLSFLMNIPLKFRRVTEGDSLNHIHNRNSEKDGFTDYQDVTDQE